MQWIAIFALSWALVACGARSELRAPATTTVDGSVDTRDVVAEQQPRPRSRIILGDRCAGDGVIASSFDPDTGDRTTLFALPTHYFVGPNGLAASLDGRRFAWSAYDNEVSDPAWRIYVQDGVDSSPQRLSWGLAQQDSPEDPAWSADGARLAISLTQGINRRIAIAPSTEGAIGAITSTNLIHRPSWSRDGQWIVSSAATNIGTEVTLYVSQAPFASAMPIATTVNSTNAVFTRDGSIATIEDTSLGRTLVIRSVPAGETVRRVALSVPNALWLDTLAAEPEGGRFALQVRSEVYVVDGDSGSVRTLYSPPGCAVAHAGLSWISRID